MKKVLTLLLTLCMIVSVCALPVSAAATISFDSADIQMLDAAEGILKVSSNLTDTVKENRYVTLIVVPEGTPLSEYATKTVALSSAIVDLEGNFYMSVKITGDSKKYDFYILYEGVSFDPVTYSFISLDDAAQVIRNIEDNVTPKDSIVSQIEAANNGIGVDFTQFPVGFERDLFVYRVDANRKDLKNEGATSQEVLASFNELVELIKGEISFVKAFNAVSYPGEYYNLLKNNVKYTKIDFTAYEALTTTQKNWVIEQLIDLECDNADEIAYAFNHAVENVPDSDEGGNGGNGNNGNNGDSTPNDRYWEVEGEPTVSTVFTDIDSVAWAKEAIYALAKKGVVAGTGYGLFQPNGNVTREQFAKMIVTATGKYDPSLKNTFTDIPSGDWSESYVASAYAASYIKGIGDGMFGYGKSITREDMAVIIYNVLKARGVSFNEVKTDFADYKQISDYAKEAVGALTAKGIINGVGDNKFAPKDTATRAQAALLVYAITGEVA